MKTITDSPWVARMARRLKAHVGTESQATLAHVHERAVEGLHRKNDNVARMEMRRDHSSAMF